ncbi:hypothetical protein Nepgr_022911 [Nepenthes gracilis]|uniref:Uncharacterized protein n=1 Tax=Nepenthes gracilis TaxID=150966 RepID=A0AAD3T1N7_NEPGR|nr:hypothetical protein Nepgr_022911 [Nepenthes gracilis]
MPEERKFLALDDSVVGCADAHWFAVSLKGLAVQSMLAVLQLPCGSVDFLSAADAWPGMILMQWLMPLLMWEPYADERWAAAVWLAWRWKG